MMKTKIKVLIQELQHDITKLKSRQETAEALGFLIEAMRMSLQITDKEITIKKLSKIINGDHEQ